MVHHAVGGFKCPVTRHLFFEPVIAGPCGHAFEKTVCVGKLQECPCCRKDITLFAPAIIVRNALDDILLEHLELWADVYFDLYFFLEILREDNKLTTPTGVRYLALLENASNHLNDKTAQGLHTGKSPIEILASTQLGRELLRKKLIVKTVVEAGTETPVQKYFFGHAEITSESLHIQVDGRSIREWLDPTVELAMQEQQAKEKMIAEQAAALRTLRSQRRVRFRLFSNTGSTDQVRPQGEAVNELLQLVVYGQRIKVREKLSQLKHYNPELLKMVLTSTATTTIVDYSGKKIENMTLLQAAHAAGDVSLHPELIASNINHQGMCEIIRSYFDTNDQAEIDTQCAEIFPNGFDACVKEQEQKAKEFHLLDLMLDAISQETSPEAIKAALDLNGARFDEADDATRRKPFEQLSLVEKFNRFREVSAKQFLSENVSNPYYLLRAIELYNAFCDRCEQDASIDPTCDKRRLFWRQIIGFIQRFVPACDGQAYAQGLWYLIHVDQDASWRPEILKNDFEFKHDRGIHFYPRSDSCSGLGFNHAAAGRARRRPSVGGGCYPDFYKNLFRAKTVVSQNLCRGGKLTHTTSQINVVAR